MEYRSPSQVSEAARPSEGTQFPEFVLPPLKEEKVSLLHMPLRDVWTELTKPRFGWAGVIALSLITAPLLSMAPSLIGKLISDPEDEALAPMLTTNSSVASSALGASKDGLSSAKPELKARMLKPRFATQALNAIHDRPVERVKATASSEVAHKVQSS